MTARTTRHIEAERAARLMPAVHRIARSITAKLPRTIDRDDLVGAGALGLATAIRAHADADDPSFERLAVCRIRGAMFDLLRATDALTRSQRQRVKALAAASSEGIGSDPKHRLETERLGLAASHQMNFDVTTSVVADSCPTVEDALVAQQTLRKVERALGALDPRLAQIIDRSFLQQHTLKQIGADLGVGEARACQLRSKAIAEMRNNTRDTLLPAA